MNFFFALAVSVVLLLILCLHRPSRYIFFLVIPEFFGKKGRSAAIAYTFALAFAGPAVNLENNIKVLTNSIVCGEVRLYLMEQGNHLPSVQNLKDQVKIALQSLIQTLEEPYLIVKEAMKEILPIIKNVAEKMREGVTELKNEVQKMVKIIKSAMLWLKEVVDVCNQTKATPFDQCIKAFETSIVGCR